MSSIKTPAQMQPCTPELLNAAMDSQRVCDTCHEIASNLAKVKEGTLTREAFEQLKSQLKADNLPVVCFHATFSDGYRHNESAVPSGLSIYDVDHLTEDPRAYYFNKVAGREVELGISLAHVSPSHEGVRLVFEIPEGMSLAEAQQWMAQQLGDDTYDGCVKDLARCSFVVCRDYVLYYDEEELFKERVFTRDDFDIDKIVGEYGEKAAELGKRYAEKGYMRGVYQDSRPLIEKQ